MMVILKAEELRLTSQMAHITTPLSSLLTVKDFKSLKACIFRVYLKVVKKIKKI